MMSTRPWILLVEDNPITRKLVRFAVQQEALDLAEAADGKSALDSAAARRPDLILQDLLLPDMSGFELAARFRARPELRGVPILAFSGLLSQLDEKRISGSGFTDFVTKPIEPSKLVRMIRAHLPSADAPKTSFGAGRRVVLADDDDVQRKLSVFKLAKLGFDVVDAADGQAALAAARTKTPAAIITDAMMPVLDGFGLCAEARKDPSLKHVPIVMLTSTYVDEADRELGRLAGANAFVIRTPALKEMVTALEGVLAPSAPAAAVPVVQPPDFERERATRTMVQLERQAAAASSARQQCATLSAELAVLNAISEAITQDADIDVVLREILAACCDAAGVSIGALYLLRPDGSFNSLMVGPARTGESSDVDLVSGARLRELIDARRAVIITRDLATPECQAWMERNNIQSSLVVPLQHKDDVLGALVMMSEGADLGADDRMLFAESVGHQVSVALALTQAFEDTAMAADAARQQATLLKSVFSSITDPIVVLDPAARPSTWNAAAEQLFEISAHRDAPFVTDEAARRIGLFKTDKATVFPTAERPLGLALEGQASEGVSAYLKNPRRPDGAWLNISARPVVGEDGKVYGAVSVNRDVTRERLANEQLMISDRMASIGMMAAGVGHEINNPLSAVIASLEMAAVDVARLARDIGPAGLGELPDEINEALTAAQRVRQIAADLKVFSGGQQDENGPTDVERVLESSLRMAWSQVRQRAKVVKHYGNVPLANGVEPRLGQVFLNLIVNAVQAIPEGALDGNSITLTTRVDPDGRIVADIADTGSGIPPHVMAQLFTPFVTTKPVGVGTGIGLSICQRLVTAMGGTIWADSTPGQGTVFHVALPPAAPVATTPSGTRIVPATAAPAKARVLVIDDEEMIGNILRRALKPHDVTVLTSARDALAQMASGARFDAILCDLMMPGMTGMDFHQALTRDYPDQVQALMFLTGGAFNKATATFLESVANPRLEKPFDVPNLRAVVDRHIALRRSPTPPAGAPT